MVIFFSVIVVVVGVVVWVYVVSFCSDDVLYVFREIIFERIDGFEVYLEVILCFRIVYGFYKVRMVLY